MTMYHLCFHNVQY